MKFILYSRFTEEVIQDHLGEPEYGYYFVLRAFRLALANLGSVEVVRQPATEVDPIFEECRARGEPCVFLPFAPPNKVLLDLKCPTVPVIAWEFTTFPDAASDPGNDWRLALEKVGRAITLSRSSAQAIAKAMGPDFPIEAIPPPIPTRLDDALPTKSPGIGLDVESGKAILDTAAMNLNVDLLAPARRLRKGDSEEIEQSSPATGRGVRGPQAAQDPRARVGADSVVYTAVLNSNDRSKNPVDLVTAFCWAFRDIADATLVVKICNHGRAEFYDRLIPILYQLSPFKCRIVVIPFFLQDLEYEKLIRAATYYVNASSSEGVCLPLMEFMSDGKPAIAPAHTAMSDYVDNGVGFVLRASRQITRWSNDPQERFRTMSFRLDWESLREAYRQSYDLARFNPDAYREMSKRARERVQQSASPAIVLAQLRRFFSAGGALTVDESEGLHSAPEGPAGRG